MHVGHCFFVINERFIHWPQKTWPQLVAWGLRPIGESIQIAHMIVFSGGFSCSLSSGSTIDRVLERRGWLNCWLARFDETRLIDGVHKSTTGIGSSIKITSSSESLWAERECRCWKLILKKFEKYYHLIPELPIVLTETSPCPRI